MFVRFSALFRLRGIIRHVLLAAVLVLLAGCSTLQLAYRQSESLLYWWLDRYVDFTAEQKPQVREALAALKRWHQQQQLPEYIGLLQRARAMAPRDIGAQEVCALSHEAQASYLALLRQIEPAATQIVRQLRPQQLRHLRQRYDHGNAEWREEWLEGSPEQQLRHRIKRARERLEDFYGRLDTPQRDALRQWLLDDGFDPALSHAERERRQADSLQVFAQMAATPAMADAQALLHGWLLRTVESPVPQHRAYAQAFWQAQCDGFARWHNSTTPAQRQRFAESLRRYEDDLRALLP